MYKDEKSITFALKNKQIINFMVTNMKKLTSFLAFALIAIMSFTFSSCDEDHEIAFELDGTWEGVVYDNHGYRYDVDFRFRQDGFSRHGRGYEYDRPGGPITFRWSVENGNIFLDYEDNTHVVIADYRLSSRYLDGYLQETRRGWNKGDIHLTKVSNNPYDSDYDYYYAKKQGKIVDDSETDSIK